MPFCSASRVTMPTSGLCGADAEMACREQAQFVAEFSAQILRPNKCTAKYGSCRGSHSR